MDIETLKKRWWIALLGTLALGGLGNGVWELAFRPFGAWLSGVLLSVVTLGSQYLKDDIYREAARGNHEAAAISAWYLLFSVFTGFMMATVYALWLSVQSINSRIERRIELMKGPVKAKQIDLDAYLESTRRQFYRNKLLLFIISGVLIFLIGDKITETIKLMASNSAYSYYEQSYAACLPYIDADRAKYLESSFAQIQSRADYLRVIDELRSIAKANKVRLRKYEPW